MPIVVCTRNRGARRMLACFLAVPITAMAGLLALHVGASTGSPSTPARAGDPPRTQVAGQSYAHVATWHLPPELEPGVVLTATVRPLDVALGVDGRLLVADGRNNAVLAFRDGEMVPSVWRAPAEIVSGRSLAVPRALAADRRTGDVHVLWQTYTGTFGGLGELTRARPGAAWLQTLRADGSSPRPPWRLPGDEAADMAMDPDTGNLAVLDGAACTAWLLDPEDGAVAGQVPLRKAGCWNRRLTVAPGGKMAVVGTGGAVTVFGTDGEAEGGLALRRNTAVDVSADAAGRLHVLVIEEADPAVLMTFDLSRRLIEVRTGADLEVPKVPPEPAWPWAIDVDASGATVALTTAEERFLAVQVTLGDGPSRQVTGDVLQRRYQPYDPIGRESGDDALALASAPDGGVVVLDGMNPAIVAFAPDGCPSRLADRPPGAREIAIGADGALFVTTANDEVTRVATGAPPSGGWVRACDCGLGGGRLAVRDRRLYVSRPRARSIRVLDTASGSELGALTLGGTANLWPEDVAAAGRTLFSSDLLSAAVHVWGDTDRLAGQWPAGILLGPHRLDVAANDGAEGIVGALMPDGMVQMHDPVDGRLLALWRPTLENGAWLGAADIALASRQRVYLADGGLRAVHLFEPRDAGMTPATPAEPGPTATLSPHSCVVRGNKVASPTRVRLGETARVTLTFTADCPAESRLSGADIVLAVDCSSSMRGSSFQAAREAALVFAARTDVRHHRLGVVAFSDYAVLSLPLTRDLDGALAALEGLTTVVDDGPTDVAVALEVIDDHFEDAVRPGAVPVVVLLSDGRFGGAPDPLPLASAMRDRGVRFYTIGLGGADVRTLTDIAGSNERFFFAPAPTDLLRVYVEVLRIVRENLAGNLVIRDEMGDAVSYVRGSASPTAVEGSGVLRWGSALMPTDTMTLSYEIRPLAAGVHPVNRFAVAEYTDADAAQRQYVFPVPLVEVIGPSATPSGTPSATATPTVAPSPTATPPPTRTASATATATPPPSVTPVPEPLFLPLAVSEPPCSPRHRPIDVALVLDASSSMMQATAAGRTKLDAAVAAAGRFVDALRLAEGDRAALVTFHSEARVLASLTGDRATLHRALARVASGTQTRLDLAIETAHMELILHGRRLGRPVMIVLTDGYANPVSPDVAVARAAEARADGIRIFTIGLGDSADLPTLRRIASRPADCRRAPDGEDLEGIYVEIAGLIPCPADEYWPRR